MNWLTWRLNNPEKAQAHDEVGAEFVQEITSRVMACRTCGKQRVVVPADEVPVEARTTIEKSTKIKEFVYCSTCKEYAGMGEWGSF